MPTTVNVADKETLDGVSTKVSAIYNKLPSSDIADKSTLDTVNTNVTYIKNNMPSGGSGGYGLVLKCVESGQYDLPAQAASSSITRSATYGGEIVLYLPSNVSFYTSCAIDGYSIPRSGTSAFEVGTRVFKIPFRNNFSLNFWNNSSANSIWYTVFKYEKVSLS